MNLSVICLLDSESDTILRTYADWFVKGFDVGLTNHYLIYMHEQTVAVDALLNQDSLIHIVFDEKSLSRVETLLERMTQSCGNYRKNKISFTCILKEAYQNYPQLERSFRQIVSQTGIAFNGFSSWVFRPELFSSRFTHLSAVSLYRLKLKIELEGQQFGRHYILNQMHLPRYFGYPLSSLGIKMKASYQMTKVIKSR